MSDEATLQNIFNRVLTVLPDNFQSVKLVISTKRKNNAYARIKRNGEMSILFGTKFLSDSSAEEIAIILTHEFAHLVLAHDLFISDSMDKNLEKRVMERDADILGLFLLKLIELDVHKSPPIIKSLLWRDAKDFTEHPHPSVRLENINKTLKIYK